MNILIEAVVEPIAPTAEPDPPPVPSGPMSPPRPPPEPEAVPADQGRRLSELLQTPSPRPRDAEQLLMDIPAGTSTLKAAEELVMLTQKPQQQKHND